MADENKNQVEAIEELTAAVLAVACVIEKNNTNSGRTKQEVLYMYEKMAREL